MVTESLRRNYVEIKDPVGFREVLTISHGL
jgi:hypothetical protein